MRGRRKYIVPGCEEEKFKKGIKIIDHKCVKKRMRTKTLQNIFDQNYPVKYPIDIVPMGMVVYNLGVGKSCSEESLKLAPLQKSTRMTSDVIFERKGFKLLDEENNETTLWCAWKRDEPNVILLWENNTKYGISGNLVKQHFNLLNNNPSKKLSHECVETKKVNYKKTDDGLFIELQLIGKSIANVVEPNFDFLMKDNYGVATFLKKQNIIESFVFLKKHNCNEIWCVVEHSQHSSLLIDSINANIYKLSCNWCIRPAGFHDFEPEYFDIKLNPSKSSVEELLLLSRKLDENIIIDCFKRDKNILGIFPTISSENEIVVWIFVVFKGFETIPKLNDENSLKVLLSLYKCYYFEGLFHELMTTQATESAVYHGETTSSPLCGSITLSNVLDNTLDGFGTLSYVREHNENKFGVTCSHCLSNSADVIHPNIDKHLGYQWNIIENLKKGKSPQLKSTIEKELKIGSKYVSTECNVDVHDWFGYGGSKQVFVDVGLFFISNSIFTKSNAICFAEHVIKDCHHEDEDMCEKESIARKYRRIPYICQGVDLQFGKITSKFMTSFHESFKNTYKKNGARTGITCLNLVSVGMAKKYVDGRKLSGQENDSYFCEWREWRNLDPMIMCNQLLFVGQERTACGVGDSGSIIFDNTDLTPIGMLHSGWGNRNDSRICIATPMNAVEKQIDTMLQDFLITNTQVN